MFVTIMLQCVYKVKRLLLLKAILTTVKIRYVITISVVVQYAKVVVKKRN